MEYWDLTGSILPPSEGYILQYTPLGVYGLIVNEAYEGIISNTEEVNFNIIMFSTWECSVSSLAQLQLQKYLTYLSRKLIQFSPS